jgi:hypothetical protein
MTTTYKPSTRGYGKLGQAILVNTVTALASSVLKEIHVSNTSGPLNSSSYIGYSAGICVGPVTGTIYFTDQNAIRKITPDGKMQTLAGVNGLGSTHTDGTGPAARMGILGNICVDSTETNLYFCDIGFCRVKKMVIATNVVTTIAGNGTNTNTDATPGTGGTLAQPGSLCMWTDDILYIGTTGATIRKYVISTAALSTLANAITAVAPIGGLCTDGTYLYSYSGATTTGVISRQVISGASAGVAISIPQGGANPANGLNFLILPISAGTFLNSTANLTPMVCDASAVAGGGNVKLYLSDPSGHTVRTIDIQALSAASATVQGVVNTLVGAGKDVFGTFSAAAPPSTTSGFITPGYSGDSRIAYPCGLALSNGSLYIGSMQSHNMARLSLADGYLHMFAGSAGNAVDAAQVIASQPSTDGNAMPVKQNGYFNLYIVPSAETLDYNKHCKFRTTPVGPSSSLILEIAKSLSAGDKVYFEPCTPGLIYDLSFLEVA